MGKGLEGKSQEEQVRVLCLEEAEVRPAVSFRSSPGEAEGQGPISALVTGPKEAAEADQGTFRLDITCRYGYHI